MAAWPRINPTFAAAAPWIAPVGGAVVGLAAAATFLLVPASTLEDWVWRSGVAALLPVAQPPLGLTARTVLALAAGGIAAAVAWSALFLLFGPDGLLAPMTKGRGEDDAPMLRRADAHPDAPARRPMSAADLGAPMPPPTEPRAVTAPPPPPAERDIPADLDQPLAAFHPGAVPDVPREPLRPVAPLRPRVALAEGERIDTVELPRNPDAAPESPSIESLLRRLEQGARRPPLRA
ncbi:MULTISPECIES: hypothetical protein [unclassified Sphingomonas]|jgi:hypothetical protein|uniref:hypothetical protein n=1 Tax=unclassified Sphingomonas TaxID=196159 RepID=UPI000E105CE0|nr:MULTISPECIES: hypothetical protein [unclassified Sphingomonas]AXJ94649.1 hypothetical protein DM480_03195 [Sphingomonas sp. FARSPH]